MTHAMDILNLVLAALAVGCLLWALRQRAVLRRVQRGLVALRDGRSDLRLQQGPEDSEPILKAFDHLAQELSSRIHDSTASSSGNLSSVLNGLCAAFRPPLVAIQSYVSLLAQDESIRKSPQQQDCIHKLRLQINGLLRLLESPSDLSALRQGLSGLRRQIATLQPVQTSSALVLVDEDGPASQALAQRLEESDCRVLVAPGADAALIMTRAVLPKAILINGSWSVGLGWRLLSQLKRLPQVGSIPIWLYEWNVESRTAALVAPVDIWLWPAEGTEDALVDDWKAQGKRLRFSIHGNAELAPKVESLLLSHGLTITQSPDLRAPVLQQCCTLVVHRNGDSPAGQGATPEFVLVAPETVLATAAGELAASFAQLAKLRLVEPEEFQKELVGRLAGVPVAPSNALLGMSGVTS